MRRRGTPDPTVLVLRFVFGAIVGAAIGWLLEFVAEMAGLWSLKMELIVVGGTALVVAIVVTIYGDRALLRLLNVFKWFWPLVP
jgi:F0F1-type ATP synthase assembly protein I